MKTARHELGLSIILAIQGAIMFVVAPLAATGMLQPLAIDLFRFALATVAVLMVTRTKRMALLIGGAFVASVALSLLIGRGDTTTASYLVRTGVMTVFDLAVASVVAPVAFGPGRVTVHRIMGGVILYLSIGIIFASFYRVAALTLNPSFAGLPESRRAIQGDMIYFSLSTLTTTGFGDITPLHPFVRSLANLEAVIGQLFPATLLARLVTLNAAHGDRERE
jgi:hypothetical protein